MNLTTHYLGLKLANPFVVGSSPFADHVHVAAQLQDAGAAAIVMRSLFEEQIDLEQQALLHHIESPAESYAEATSYFPRFEEYQLTPDHYLRQIESLKKTLTIPVISSLNGRRVGGWTEYASRIEQAGADALELNLYQLVSDPDIPADQVEADLLEIVRSVVSAVQIPVGVKLSPFHTSLVQFIRTLETAGIAGVVLFNRFYQPDLDIEELDVHPQLKLSDSGELLMRLRWLAIVSPHVRCSLAASGGVHTTEDAIKAILAGAHITQLVSVLLKHGPRLITTLIEGLRHWMSEHDYQNLTEMRGALNLRHSPDAGAFERSNYVRILQSWRI